MCIRDRCESDLSVKSERAWSNRACVGRGRWSRCRRRRCHRGAAAAAAAAGHMKYSATLMTLLL